MPKIEEFVAIARQKGRHGELLQKIRDISGWSKSDLSELLIQLILYSKPAWFETLVQKGADPNIKDDEHNTPLGVCIDIASENCGAESNLQQQFERRRSVYLAFIELLASGADPNLDCQIDNTPLTLAIGRNLPEFTAALLVFGADPHGSPPNQHKESAINFVKGFGKPRWPLHLLLAAETSQYTSKSKGS